MATQYTAGLTTGQVLTAATMNQIGAAWESYTPTLTQPGAITKTVQYAKYTQINKLCVVNVRLDVTGTGTGNNAVIVGLPLTATNSTFVLGTVSIYDASAGITYSGACYFNSTTTVQFVGDWSGNTVFGINPNIALGASDQIHVSISYEVT